MRGQTELLQMGQHIMFQYYPLSVFHIRGRVDLHKDSLCKSTLSLTWGNLILVVSSWYLKWLKLGNLNLISQLLICKHFKPVCERKVCHAAYYLKLSLFPITLSGSEKL